MLRGIRFAVYWAVLSMFTVNVDTDHTDVECFPNNTITLTNPIPDTLFFGSAIDSNGECNVTFSDDFGLIIINDCAKSEPIVVQLSDVQHTNIVIGGADKVLVSIQCQEITQGVERNFTHGLSVGLVADETVGVNQTFAMFSHIRNGSVTSPPVAAARLLEELFLTYDLDDDYVLTFLLCTAYAGTDTTSFPNSYKLIENDCSADTDLIKSFSPNKTEVVGSFNRYYTEITMFRFWVSMYITIVCDVKICLKQHSEYCTMNTCANTRKRRSPEVDNKENPDVEYKSSRTTFKVLENPDYIFSPYLSSSYFLTPGTYLLLMALMTASVLEYARW